MKTKRVLISKEQKMSQKIYEKPKVSIQIIKNAKSLHTNNQKCKIRKECNILQDSKLILMTTFFPY